MSTTPDHRYGARAPHRSTPFLHGFATAWLGFAGCALAITGLAGCGGGQDASQDDPGTAGLRVEEEWWDEAQTVRKLRATTRYGKYVGDYEEFHQNGMPALTGRYSDDGSKVGEWKSTYPNGLEKRREIYVDGVLSGEALEWHPDGSLSKRETHAAGAPVGEWRSFHEGTDEAVKEITTYENGVSVGTFQAFYPSGELYMEVPLVEGKPEGKQRFYYPGGAVEREVDHVGGVPHGLETLYHEAGMRRGESRWVNGAKTGITEGWYPNGARQLRGRHEAGLAVGLWKKWHANGNPQLFGTYAEGKPSGEWREWYEDGALERVASFDDAGAPTGLFREWWPDGSRKRYCTVAGGTQKQIVFQGPVYVWDEQGALDTELSGQFENGTRVGPLDEEQLVEAENLAANPDQPAPVDYGSDEDLGGDESSTEENG